MDTPNDTDMPTRLGARGSARRASEHPPAMGATDTPTLKLKSVPPEPAQPTSHSVAPSSSIGTRSGTSIASALEAQTQGAVDNLRMLSGTMLVWTLVGIPMIVFTPGAFVDKILCGVGLVIVAIGYGAVYWRTRSGTNVHIDDLFGVSIVTALAGSSIAMGAGICSPYTGLIALALTFFCSSAAPRRAVQTYAFVAVSHLVMGALALTDVITTTGLLDPLPRSDLSIALNVLWVETLYLSALGIGQLAYRESSGMLGRLELAVREAAQRDALWREVRAELDRAAKLGGPGQFTGQTLGRYKLAEVIGRGGMGEVYVAERLDGGPEAAIKLLRREALSDPDVVTRFEREARIVEQLRSPHVVEVYEAFGREALVPYIAMERLRGADLASELRTMGVMSTHKAAELVREVALGLDAAHAAGIVHRDLKPSNLFHAEDADGKRRWKILDFGVSKLLGSDDATLTQHQLVGTPQYMAPEQTTGGKNVDHRADIHALAAIGYRALTGRMAFSKGDIGQVMFAVATEIPEDPRVHRDLSEDVALVLRIGLAKRPSDRFDRASELAEALTDALEGSLPESIRARGRKLVAAEPWGARIDRA